MNVYGAVILATLLLGYSLNLIADLLNLKTLGRELPTEFRDVYDAEAYRRSQDYTRARTRFAQATATFELAVLLAFWLAGGFNRLDLWLRGFGLGPMPTGLAYVGLLALGMGMLSLPSAAYSTFVIEERFGFNRTTPRTFVFDVVKGLALSIVLGAPLLALVLLFLERAGEAAWLYCWGAVVAFSLMLTFVFPVWILPLFNRFTPLEESELRSALEAYARSAGFALGGIFTVDGSRRTSRANAFFTGFGRSKRIALYDTLVQKHTVPELVAVLAHEVGHYKRRHLLKILLLNVVHSGAMLYLLSVFLRHRGLFDAFFMEHASVYSGLVFFGLLYSPIELLLAIYLNHRSRRQEYEADRFAVETLDQPLAMASALEKMSADNLVHLEPHPFYVLLHHSHPPMLERVAAIRRAARG